MKAVIFDVMGVIFEVNDDINELLIPFIQEKNPSISCEEIEELFLQGSSGKFDSEEFWRKVGLAKDAGRLDEMYFPGRFTLDKEFLPLVDFLKANYKIGLLSNDIATWSDFLTTLHGVSPLVDVSIVSGKVGIRKPDARIFEILLKKLDLSASDCIYIDDRIPNVEAANKLGFKALLFNRTGLEYDGKQITSFKQVYDFL